MLFNLGASDQVAYLKEKKDVSFALMNEAEAECFLRDRSYSFKLKAFAKYYDKRFKDGDRKGCCFWGVPARE